MHKVKHQALVERNHKEQVMLIIRPIKHSDLDALLLCAKESGHGFTSLPVERDLLNEKINRSIASFAANVKSPGFESYLMVAEDSKTGEVAGTTGIEAAVGLDTPFYTYHLGKIVHHSKRLNVQNTLDVLTLGNNYTGASEICTLYLKPAYRKGGNGRLLSKVRFLLLAEFPEKFSELVFAEMRGVSDEKGDSPFWGWLKEHFFSIEFKEADYLSGTGQKEFIAELMPKLPIYANLLSDEARAVIGQVHQHTRPALRLLKQEGFRCRGYVDIFDAGPTLECQRLHIDSVRRSQRAKVKLLSPKADTKAPVNDTYPKGQTQGKYGNYLIANTHFSAFRATAAMLFFDKDTNQVSLTQDIADALQVKDQDSVRLVLLSEK